MLLLKKFDSSAKVVKQTPCNAVSLAVSGAYTSDKFFLRTFFFYFNLIIDDLDGEKTQILQNHQNKAYAEKLFACLSAKFPFNITVWGFPFNITVWGFPFITPVYIRNLFYRAYKSQNHKNYVNHVRSLQFKNTMSERV